MKNKAAISIVITYVLLIILLSFWKDRLTYIVSQLIYIFKDAKNIDLIGKIIEYLLIFIVYFTFGSFLYIALIGFYEKKISAFTRCLIISLAFIVLGMTISSFFDKTDYLMYVFRLMFSYIGIGFGFIFLRK